MAAGPELRALGGALGAEVLGVDLSAPLDDETFGWIRRAFAENPVLVFRDQDLGAEQLAAFGRRFGRPRPHSLVDYRHPDNPEVSYLRNVDKHGKVDWFGVKRAADWHTDSTYEPVLPVLAILHALEVPSEKGGTIFADMVAAYAALPGTMKERLSALTCLHNHTRGPTGGALYDSQPKAQSKYPDMPWPAIISHPVTGKPILFVNPMHVHAVQGMEHDDAWQLILDLAEHATQDRFTYYHHWRVGDVLMWDEQATMHRGAGDYRPEERRVMLRTIVYPG
jgi:taurine dioxygenase